MLCTLVLRFGTPGRIFKLWAVTRSRAERDHDHYAPSPLVEEGGASIELRRTNEQGIREPRTDGHDPTRLRLQQSTFSHAAIELGALRHPPVVP